MYIAQSWDQESGIIYNQKRNHRRNRNHNSSNEIQSDDGLQHDFLTQETIAAVALHEPGAKRWLSD